MDAPEVPGYRLGSLLGSGGSGEVWSATPVESRDRVAVKVIRPGADGLDAALREAAVLRETVHEHVLRVRDVVTLPEGRLVLVLELAEGGSLAALLTARGHLSTGEVVTAMSPVAAALTDLHRDGVVHGDLSPGNVLFTADGRPLLADLGVSRVIGEAPGPTHGTSGFVAPELLDGAVAAPASDVYALGALTWFCLTGEPPGPAAVRAPLLELAPGTPDAVVDVVERALSGLPSRRPTPGEIATTLFDAAPARPLVLAPGLDPAQGITYRIRSGAGELADGQPQRQGAPMPRLRTALAVAAVAGVVLGGVVGGAVALGRGGAFGTPLDRTAEPRASAGMAMTSGDRPAGAGHPVDAAVHRGSGPTPGPGRSRPSHQRSLRGQGARDASSSDDGAKQGTARQGSAAAAADVTRSPEALVRRRSAARRHPTRLLATLARWRAAAWRQGSPEGLTRALAPGSPALSRDRDDLTRVQRAGAQYDGLSFEVRRTRVRPVGGSGVRISAAVTRSAYRVERAGQPPTEVPRDRARRVEIRLRWTDEGWRIADWG